MINLHQETYGTQKISFRVQSKKKNSYATVRDQTPNHLLWNFKSFPFRLINCCYKKLMLSNKIFNFGFILKKSSKFNHVNVHKISHSLKHPRAVIVLVTLDP